MRINRIFSIFLFFSFGLIFTLYVLVWKTSSLHKKSEEYIVFIEPNESFEVFFEADLKPILRFPKLFLFLAEQMNLPNHFYAGKYSFTSDITIVGLIKTIRSGKFEMMVVDLPQGIYQDSLLKIISEAIFLSEDRIKAVLMDCRYFKNNQQDLMPLLTFCFADRYFMPYAISEKKLQQFFEKEFKKVWNENRLAKAKEIGLLPVEVTALAAIVQAEVVYKDEMGRVAGVYINRLKKGWRLNADPSIRFILRNKSVKRILNEDLKLKNPYNTYQRGGIPPGAIGLVSLRAIDAVLNFEKHGFMFFCAKPDLSFRHIFSKTYTEHLIIAKQYQKAMNERNIVR